MRVEQRKLTFLALCVLDEVFDGAPASPGLRLALGYLHSVGDGDRHAVDTFWRYAREPAKSESDPNGAGRYQMLNAMMNGICRSVGFERDVDLMRALRKARGSDVSEPHPRRALTE